MKKIVLLSLALFAISLVSYTQLQARKAPQVAKFQWDETTHNFGKIKQGVPQTVNFTFTNVGDEPIIITSVKGSCGCTATDYTKSPVQKNGKGSVTATYNAASLGAFTKTITVNANTPEGTVTLHIVGEVIN